MGKCEDDEGCLSLHLIAVSELIHTFLYVKTDLKIFSSHSFNKVFNFEIKGNFVLCTNI